MCTDDSPAEVPPPVLCDFQPAIEIGLEPIESVWITTLTDNVTDPLMPDKSQPAAPRQGAGPREAAAVIDNGEVPVLIAEHGFFVLVTVSDGDREYRLLYHAGTSPDGVVENMRRLDTDPARLRRSCAAMAIRPHDRHRRADPDPRWD